MKPGEILRQMLKQQGVTQTELSHLTGYTQKHISYVINNKTGISAEFALALEKVLDVDARYWMTLQAEHKLALAKGA